MTHGINAKAALLLTLAPLLWAGNAIVGRLMVGAVPPLALNALRWAIALLVLLPLAWRVLRKPQDITSRWKYLAVLGLVGVGSYNALQYLALQTSTPLNVTLISASLPLWMLGVGALLYRERPALPQIVGAVLSLAGVALVLSHGQASALLALRLVPGDLWMLLATVIWAVYSWMLARPPASMRGPARPAWGPTELLMVQILFGSLWAGAAAGLETTWHADGIHWSPGVCAALAYVAIGPSLIAYRCWGVGVAAVGPAVAGFFINLTPVFAGLLSAALLREMPRWYHLVAFVLIAAGIIVSARRA